MKLLAILFCFVGAAAASAQTTYSVSTLFSFPASNTGPTGITVDSHGNIYAAGSFTTSPNAPGIAQIFPPTSVGGNGSAVVIAGGTLNGFADGTGSTAQFSTPEGMFTDSTGNIYVADVLANESATIRKVVPSTRVVTTLSGLNGSTQMFSNANGVAVSTLGNIYVSAAGGSSGDLSQYVPGGAPILISVAPITDMQDSGQTINAYPIYGVAVDSSNSLYVTAVVAGPNSGHSFGPTQLYVLKINNSTTQLYALPLGANSQLEPSLSALSGTVPIAIDGSGNVYVGWYGNLYLYNSQSGPTEIATIGGQIVGLATDSLGRIYVASGPPGYRSNGINGPGQITVVAPAGVAPLPSTPIPTTTPIPPAPIFINISTRANVGIGSSIAIAGFVISGSANEEVLIRAVGPTLAQYSVSGVLAQPVLTLFDSAGTQVASNTGWGTNSNPSQISAAFTATGAFALPSGSADSALLLTLAPGLYTAQVSGLNNTTGIALIEVYEVPTATP